MKSSGIGPAKFRSYVVSGFSRTGITVRLKADATYEWKLL